MKGNTDNLPLGAEYDSLAPFNEPLNVRHRRFVSLTISYYTDIEGSPDMTEEQIEESVRNSLENRMFPNKFWIDEVCVMED